MAATRTRAKIPLRVEAELMAAHNHMCCICRGSRKHVQVHHIDGDPSNNEPENLAVVCLDCHSRVTGDEGLGRRFTEREVRLYKERWEIECAGGDEDDGGEDEPIHADVREFVVRSENHVAFFYDLEVGELLLAAVDADGPVDVLIASERKYQRWDDDEEIRLDVLIEDHLRAKAEFVAPRDGRYVLWIENTDDDDDATVQMDLTIWRAEDGDEADE